MRGISNKTGAGVRSRAQALTPRLVRRVIAGALLVFAWRLLSRRRDAPPPALFGRPRHLPPQPVLPSATEDTAYCPSFPSIECGCIREDRPGRNRKNPVLW